MRISLSLSLGLSLGLAMLAVCTLPAQAAFSVCNKTKLPARVAIGRFDGKSWSSEGWWTVKPNVCAPILTGALVARYYYLYASDGEAGVWDGKTKFCVAPAARFKADGRGHCAARGFDTRGFFGIDTGKAPNWTQSLSN